VVLNLYRVIDAINKMESLLGSTLTSKGGAVPTASLVSDGKTVALYFSAHWCPPCRGFTPKLADYYVKAKRNGANFEIVFVSSDSDEESFEAYYGEMPWMALPFADRDKKQQLSSKFGVQGIPTLIFLDAVTGEIKNRDGWEIVVKDPEGKNFPY